MMDRYRAGGYLTKRIFFLGDILILLSVLFVENSGFNLNDLNDPRDLVFWFFLLFGFIILQLVVIALQIWFARFVLLGFSLYILFIWAMITTEGFFSTQALRYRWSTGDGLHSIGGVLFLSGMIIVMLGPLIVPLLVKKQDNNLRKSDQESSHT